MANVISSAIVNTPPPEVMGDILNKRNKTHHFDGEVRKLEFNRRPPTDRIPD